MQPPITTKRIIPSISQENSDMENLKFQLRGNCMMDFGGLYSEFAQKFHFPHYFGENMNALYDMLTDLSWLQFYSIEIIIEQSDLFMSLTSKEDREAVVNLLEQVSDFWKNSYEEDELWGHAETDFKITYIP